MTHVYAELRVHRGKTEPYALTIRDGAGALINLDAKSLTLTVRRELGDVAIATKTTGAGITHRADQAGAGKGLADVLFAPADFTALPNRRQVLVYDVELVDGASEYQAVWGRLELLPVVTT